MNVTSGTGIKDGIHQTYGPYQENFIPGITHVVMNREFKEESNAMLNLKSPSLKVWGILSLAFVAGTAQAAVLSIDDIAESLGLTVAAPNSITSVGDLPPGSGSAVDLTQSTDPANKLSNIVYNPGTELLSFTFADQVPWNGNFFAYKYYSEGDGTFSDLFIIQGIGGTTPDQITFSSADTLTGDFATDAANIGLQVVQTATPVDLGTETETGTWQLAFDTGVDQYYIQSDTPEPATMLLVGSGLVGVALASRRRRKI